MDIIFKDLPDFIVLKDPMNPLSAVGKKHGDHVYKYAYNPKTGRLLYVYPGDRHVSAISEAGDADYFKDYVRVIYDYKNNVAGSRERGSSFNTEDENNKSFEEQYAAFKFFKQFDPSLKWILNLTNIDLTSDEEEALDSSEVFPNRILDDAQMEELSKNFKKIYEDKKLKSYWRL